MYKTFSAVSLALLAASALAAGPDVSKLPRPAEKKGVSYTKDVQPILKSTCFGCHGEQRQKGALRLDTLEMALKGGKSGAVIVPGKSEKSVLVIAVARIDADLSMPPTRRPGAGGPDAGPKPLTAEQVGLIRAWIDQGAK